MQARQHIFSSEPIRHVCVSGVKLCIRSVVIVRFALLNVSWIFSLQVKK